MSIAFLNSAVTDRTAFFLNFLRADPSKGREIDLDVVRGIAILLAMGWHFNQQITPSHLLNFVLWPGHTFGWAGVDLFFVLSGFLVGRLVLQEIQRTGTLSRAKFFERRAFKLWPNLYVFLALFLFSFSWRLFFFQIGLHVQNYFRTPVATHLWSLAVEEQFYLIFAFLAPVYFTKSRPAWGFAAIMLGLMASVLVGRFVAFANGVNADTLQVQTQYRIDALAAGVFLATLAVHYPVSLERLLRFRPVWVIVMLAGCVFLAHYPKSSPLGCTLGFTVAYLTSAAALLAIYKSGIERLIPWLCRPIAWAGVYSYAIYIWHVPAEKLTDKHILAHHVSNLVAVVIIHYVVAILAGYLMTRLLERPFLALREWLFPAKDKIGVRSLVVAPESSSVDSATN